MAEYPPNRRQTGLTIVAPIAPGEEEHVVRCAEAARPEEVAGLDAVHFLSVFVLPPGGRAREHRLVLEANVDGEPRAFLERLVAADPKFWIGLFARCSGFPSAARNGGAALVDWLRSRDLGAGTYYVAFPGLGVEQIRRDARLDAFAASFARDPRRIGEGGTNRVFRRLWLAVNSDPELLGTLVIPERPFWVRHGQELVHALGGVLRAAALVLPLLTTGWMGTAADGLSRGKLLASVLGLATTLAVLAAGWRWLRSTRAGAAPPLPAAIALAGTLLLSGGAFAAGMLDPWAVSAALLEMAVLGGGAAALVFALPREAPEEALVLRAAAAAAAVLLVLVGVAALAQTLAADETGAVAARGGCVLLGAVGLVGAGGLLRRSRGAWPLLALAAVAVLLPIAEAGDAVLYAARALVALLALAALAVVYLLCRIRAEERHDKEHESRTWEDTPDKERIRAWEARPGAAQNHLVTVNVIRRGKLRLGALRVKLWTIRLGHRLYYNRGRLGALDDIHFARWVILPSGELLFVSNYAGGWEQYLGDFVDKSSAGITQIWSHTEGFPRSRWLSFGGAAEESRFKVFARNSQVPTRLWYQAYPQTTVAELQRNLRRREALQQLRTGAAADAALRDL